MKPVADHLKVPQEHSAFNHLRHTVTEPRYLMSFVSVLFLATGGFMLMPFSSAFTVNNLGISLHDLPIIYLVTGIATIFIGPLVGKASDSFGTLRVFFFGTAVMIVMVLIYTNLSTSTLVVVTVINVVLFVGIFSRMIPFQALMSQVPAQTQRGSFNAINASISQLAGGLASVVAGHIVQQGADGKLHHYEIAGYVVVATSLLASVLLWRIHRERCAVSFDIQRSILQGDTEPEPAKARVGIEGIVVKFQHGAVGRCTRQGWQRLVPDCHIRVEDRGHMIVVRKHCIGHGLALDVGEFRHARSECRNFRGTDIVEASLVVGRLAHTDGHLLHLLRDGAIEGRHEPLPLRRDMNGLARRARCAQTDELHPSHLLQLRDRRV